MKYERLQCPQDMITPFGVSVTEGPRGKILLFTVKRDCKELFLRLWTKKTGLPEKIGFKAADKIGEAWRLRLLLLEETPLIYYNYIADGREFLDSFASLTDASEKWGRGFLSEGKKTEQNLPRVYGSETGDIADTELINKIQKSMASVYGAGAGKISLETSLDTASKSHALRNTVDAEDFASLNAATAENKSIYDKYAENKKAENKKEAPQVLRGIIKTSEDCSYDEAGRTALENTARVRAEKPALSYEDMIVYRLHARGFTAHRSSGVESSKRGRFSGIEEKLPYLKELGINAVELMPFYEFNERLTFENANMPGESAEKINYWGFTGEAMRFSAKNAFGGEKELISLIEALHKNGIEIILDVYFSGKEEIWEILSVLRHYAAHFNADGIHIIGFAPLEHIADDPYLKGVKLWADSFDDYLRIRSGREASERGLNKAYPDKKEASKLIADYNDGFLEDIRRYLKGDEGMLWRFTERAAAYSRDKGLINYIANVNGFTLNDFVSYDYKHNEANGENNLDGACCNYSWNCGAEGETGRRRIKELRQRQMKNALLLLFISQGTPLLLAGDEMGHTKKGNNNSYCQDNALEWINWGDISKNNDIFEFTKKLIAFRKEHRVFHEGREIRNMDYERTGLPDVSYHGESAWRAEFEGYRRSIGILFNGAYARDIEGKADSAIYVAVNMHWEPHRLSLPDLNAGKANIAGLNASIERKAQEKPSKKNIGERARGELPGESGKTPSGESCKALKENKEAFSCVVCGRSLKEEKWYKIIDTSLAESFLEKAEPCFNREVIIKERSISVFIGKQGE